MLFSVESFLSQDESFELLCDAFSADEKAWYGNSVKSGDYWDGRKLPYSSKTMEILNLRLSKYFADYERISPFHSIQRIPVDDYMGEHNDKNIPENKYGCVVYINDDYEGGELVFPRMGITVKPKAGMLLVHSSEEPHLINTVRMKTRYMMTCFVYGSIDSDPKIIVKP
jgi:hypothetical protein